MHVAVIYYVVAGAFLGAALIPYFSKRTDLRWLLFALTVLFWPAVPVLLLIAYGKSLKQQRSPAFQSSRSSGKVGFVERS